MLDYISIVIPAKNEEKYIAVVLSSLSEAITDYGGDCEIILVDNGSTDSTRDIATKFGCKVIEDKCATIAGLRNIGAQEASGDVIAFLDADCKVDEGWIRYCIEKIENDNIGIVGTRAIPDFNNATWIEDGIYKLFSGAERPDYPKWIGTSNIFIRKEKFFEVGGFDEHLETAEDVNLCRKISSNYLICLEKRINTIHLKESKTILQMIKKEIWRGSYSIRQLLASNNKLGEIKSFVLPLCLIMLITLTMIGIVIDNVMLTWIWVCILLLPIVMIIKNKAICKTIIDFKNIYAVSFFYLVSRTIATIYEIYVIVTKCTTKDRIKNNAKLHL